MKIRYLGHSCFALTSSTGFTVVTDPFGDIGLSMPSVRADAVSVSHSHFDHNAVNAVSGAPKVCDRAGEYASASVKMTAFKSWHDDAEGRKRGENLIFRYEVDGFTICHLGDLGENCATAHIERILPVDILLIPVGGVYTIDAEEARAYVDAIKPRIVIPMHFCEQGKTVDLNGVEQFLAKFDGEQVVKAGSEIELTHETVAKEGIKIILMERQS